MNETRSEPFVPLPDALIPIPSVLGGAFSPVQRLATCADWCSEDCGTCYEVAGECGNCETACEVTCQTGQCGTCQSGQCGTCQSCQCSGQNNQTVEPTPSAPSITNVAVTAGSKSVTVSWSASTVNGIHFLIDVYDDGSAAWWPKTSGLSASTRSAVITVDKFKQYRVRVGAYNGAGTTAYSAAVSFTTYKVKPWSWTASNGSASNGQTQSAHTAVTGGGSLQNFSYLVWNDLCDKVNETAGAAGDAWMTNWGTLAATKMSASNRTLTAQRFNALKNNIGARVSTGIADVSAGRGVLGGYFTTMASRLNTWIDSL